MRELSKEAKVTRAINSTAAGETAVVGTVIDMLGFEAISMIACFGTLSAGAVTGVKWQQGTLANGSDLADIAGSGLAIPQADSNGVLISDLIRPTMRYVAPVVTRGTGNAVIDSVCVLQYRGERVMPVVQDTTVAAIETNVNPVLGSP